MKITVISIEDPKDKRTWSGTTSHMYEALKNMGVEVDTITLRNWFTKFYTCYARFIYKFIKRQSIANFETTKIGAKYWGKRVDRLINKQSKKSDCYFCPAGASIIALSSSNVKFIYVPDATYKIMNNYYYSEVDKKSENMGNKIDQLAIEKATKIIVPSKWTYNSVINDYSQSKKKVSLIHFGSNMPFQKTMNRSLYNKDVINLLLVGGNWKRKGIDIALETLTELNRNSTKKYILTIIGLKSSKEFNQKNVIFKGKLNKNNKDELKMLQNSYKKADIFFLPTQAEAAGIVFAEAAMYGLPTVTCKTGGVGDYVLDNITGFTLSTNANAKEFASKIKLLVDNNKIYEDFSKNAISYYKDSLNWEEWSKKALESFYACN